MRSPILSKYPSAAKSGVALPIVNAARPIMMLLFIFLENSFFSLRACSHWTRSLDGGLHGPVFFKLSLVRDAGKGRDLRELTGFIHTPSEPDCLTGKAI
jgi:hypothetical protein